MGMLHSDIYPVILLPRLSRYCSTSFTPISLYPVVSPAPLPRCPVTPEDSRCESS
jgi:hypothetical protein